MVGLITGLFHDVGYLRRADDLESRNGAEFTRTHVSRGARFLTEYLPVVGLGHWIPVVTQIIHSVKPANPDLIKDNQTVDRGSKIYTYRSFLSSNAMRATNALDGIDYCTSNNSAACALPVISAPLLIMVMGANDFVRDDEKMLDTAKSSDKDYVAVEGAVHEFRPCKPEYGDTQKRTFDYVDEWLSKPGRF